MCWPRVWFVTGTREPGVTRGVSKDMLPPVRRPRPDRTGSRGWGGGRASTLWTPPVADGLSALSAARHSKDVGAATCFASSPLSHGWTSLLIHRQIADRIHVVPLRNLYRSVYPRILIRVRSNEPRNPGTDYWDGKPGHQGFRDWYGNGSAKSEEEGGSSVREGAYIFPKSRVIKRDEI